MDSGLASLIGDIPDPKIRLVAQHWLNLYRQAGGIPSLRLIDPLQLHQALPDTWILDLHDDGMPSIRLAGETLADWFGRSLKGLRLDEVYNAQMLPLMLDMVRRVTDTPGILLQHASSTPATRSFAVPFDRLILPLCDDAGAIRHVLGVSVFSSRDGHGHGPERTSIETEKLYRVGPAMTEHAA
ncbi:MAG: PAS domain-containing protein [Ferrovibrio sp.]|uniref:PAS domain-containing protein n=1 Tax=Ferrovibrio sp. TaxID=1917215 RepID=UPI00391ADDB9